MTFVDKLTSKEYWYVKWIVTILGGGSYYLFGWSSALYAGIAGVFFLFPILLMFISGPAVLIGLLSSFSRLCDSIFVSKRLSVESLLLFIITIVIVYDNWWLVQGFFTFISK